MFPFPLIPPHILTVVLGMSCRAVFKYEGSQVMVAAKGESFDDFKAQFGEDERAFAYIRLQVILLVLLKALPLISCIY